MQRTAVELAAIASAMIIGCSTEPDSNADDTREIVENLRQVGYGEEAITVVGDDVYLQGDIEVSLAASREMLQDGSTKEQYRFANLVAGPNPSTICVNGAAFAGVFSTGLNLALANYSALFGGGGFRLRFVRVTGGPVAGCTFFINGVIQPGLVGGTAGIPAGGAPFPQITIGGGLSAFSVDVIEHVITHELGHCIGLAHSDATVNPSCPSPGVIHIPGTPTGFTPSLMNCSFTAGATGEFSPTDITALNILY